MERSSEQQEIPEAVREAIFISSVCITGSIITRYFTLKPGKEHCTEKHREAEVAEEMQYRRILMMMQRCRHLWRKPQNTWAILMYGAVRPRQRVLTVPDSCAGCLPTVVSMICHGPRHRAFMTSVFLFRRQMQRQGTLSFLQALIIHRVLSVM